MRLYIEIQHATQFSPLPVLSQLRKWVDITLQVIQLTLDTNLSSLTVRFIDREECAALNKTYRYKKGPTNILSFSNEPIPGFPSDSLGDLAICAPVVFEEAKIQNKFLEAHFSHLFVHGVLHLLGYDHIEIQEAAEMERLEIKALSQLGYGNPYEEK